MWKAKDLFVSPQRTLNDSTNMLDVEFGEFVFLKRIRLQQFLVKIARDTQREVGLLWTVVEDVY